ncbi:MAG: hypothetical protein KBG26_05425, partial [Bacteroidales bacterium]|nr:hypothetical protein [Bacteroidales bacterium]
PGPIFYFSNEHDKKFCNTQNYKIIIDIQILIRVLQKSAENRSSNSVKWLGGYKFGYELLLLNGLLTFISLWIFSEPGNKTRNLNTVKWNSSK